MRSAQSIYKEAWKAVMRNEKFLKEFLSDCMGGRQWWQLHRQQRRHVEGSFHKYLAADLKHNNSFKFAS